VAFSDLRSRTHSCVVRGLLVYIATVEHVQLSSKLRELLELSSFRCTSRCVGSSLDAGGKSYQGWVSSVVGLAPTPYVLHSVHMREMAGC
jgi:hypothetical protein